MAETERIALEIVTPDRRLIAEDVDSVVLPSVNGYLGVLPGHAPLLARMQIGELELLAGGKKQRFAVTGGYAEVLQHAVNILATAAERLDEIDVERARQAEERARKRLKGDPGEVDFARAEASLARALNRISARERAGL
jgi:F-type H+-transporting ATPase subunit epsilon